VKFLLQPKFFIIPGLSGIILLFQNWIPGAVIFCVVFNIFVLIVTGFEYILLPDERLISVKRLVPDQFYHLKKEIIGLKIFSNLKLPVKITIQDRVPHTLGDHDAVYTEVLPAGENELELEYSVCPRQRGIFSFELAGVRITTRIGFIAKQFTIPLKQDIKVYPAFKINKNEFLSRFYYLDAPNRRMRSYGPGNEFEQVRDYVIGDDMRTVHWKQSAKRGNLVVKEYEPEKGQNLFIMFDGGRLMMAEFDGKSKLDWAISAGMTLAEEALNKSDSVGVLTFTSHVEQCLVPSNRKKQLKNIVQSLYQFQPQYLEPNYKMAVNTAHSILKQRSIVIIFTDFFDSYLSEELISSIQFLKQRHKVICVVISQPELMQIAYKSSESILDATVATLTRESIDNHSQILQSLRNSKVGIVEAEPDEIMGGVLNAYMQTRWN